MRTAIGLIAGPERPPVMLAMRGRRVSTSIASDTKVLTSEIASAPPSSATRPINPMSVTFGESFTISGRRAAALHRATSSHNCGGSVPKTMPPWLVFGQLAFSSYIAMPGASLSAWITSRQSSIVKPKTFAMTTVSGQPLQLRQLLRDKRPHTHVLQPDRIDHASRRLYNARSGIPHHRLTRQPLGHEPANAIQRNNVLELHPITKRSARRNHWRTKLDTRHRDPHVRAFTTMTFARRVIAARLRAHWVHFPWHVSSVAAS